MVPGLALLAATFLIPLIVVLQASLTDIGANNSPVARLFSSSLYLSVLWHTLSTSLTVATLCVLVGYPVAYFISRQPPSRRSLLIFLILVPLWMSILVRTYAWMIVLGREGIVNMSLMSLGLTAAPLKLSFTTASVYLVMVQVLLPFLIMTCYSAMVDIDDTLLRAARVLGASSRQAFVKVFLPLSLEGVVSGFMLVFMISMGFFIVPALVGGARDVMIANLISDQVEKVNWDFAAVLALVLLAVTLAAMAGIRFVGRRLVFDNSEVAR